MLTYSFFEKRSFFSFSYRFLFRFPIVLKAIVFLKFLKRSFNDRFQKRETTLFLSARASLILNPKTVS